MEAQELFDAARDAEEAGDHRTAETLYRRVMKADRSDPAAAFNLGNLLRGEQRVVEAEAAFRAAVKADPTCCEAYYNLADLLDEQGRLADAQKFSYDLAELAQYYCGYAKLMDHWRRVLPAGALLEVQYEAVVDDLEGQVRRLLEFCGLRWSKRCLHFHATERQVRSASADQVRKPLYRTSGHWKRYERYLEPLLEELRRPPALVS